MENYRSMIQVWYFAGIIDTTNKTVYNILSLFLHWIPAYIVDFIAKCLGKKPMLELEELFSSK